MQHAARSLWATLLIVTVCAASMVAIILLFGGNLLKPALEHYVSYKSHRIVKADDMRLQFSSSLRPTIKFHNLYIQNAPWAFQGQPSSRPLIAAKDISFSFVAFRMPFSEKPGIVEISMSDGEVNLESMKDGLRNWRLLEPDYRGPGKYLVMSLRANRSRLYLTNHGINLDLVAESSPIRTQSSIPAVTGGLPADPLSNRITFNGTYHDNAFAGEALTGQTITFHVTGKKFPIHGVVHSGKAELNISGQVGDIFKDQLIDADFHFSGASASTLNPFMNAHFPNTPPIIAYTHLVKTGNDYYATHLQGKLGGTDISGNLAYSHIGNRPFIKATLSSNETQLNDLMAMMREHGDSNIASSDTKLPIANNPASIELLKSQDLDLVLNVNKLISPALPPIENLYLKVTLNNGDLKASPVHAKLFGSTVNAALSLNTQNQPTYAQIVIDAQNLAIDQALSNTKWRDMIAAPLTAHINMNGTGNSQASLLDSASGNMDFKIGHGEISNKLDAKMGLDFGKLVWLSLRGDTSIAVNSGAIHLDFKNGLGLAHYISIDTAQTITRGTGSINLGDGTLDFLLTPKPKNPTIFSLSSNIRIYGPLSKPAFKLEHKPSAEHASQH